MLIRRSIACLLALCALLAAGAATGATLERVRDKGVMVFGYIPDAAPFSFTDAKGEPQGYSVELCREVASGVRQQLGLKTLEVRWVSLTQQNRLEAVRTGRVDVECSTTTWTLGRQKDVDFSLITFIDGASVVARGDSDVFRFADFAGKRIAVIRSTTTFDVLKQALQTRSISASVVPVASRAEGMQLLQKGEVDGFASDRVALIARVLQDGGKDTFKLLDDDFSLEQYALALPRGDHDFRLAVNRVIARLYRTGDIMKIYERWLGDLGKPSMLLYAAYVLQALSE